VVSGIMEVKLSNIKNGAGAAVDKRISFLSDNQELNAAISRYFKYVHKFPITTHIFPHTPHHSTTQPLTTHPSTTPPLTLIVQNEIEINSSICGIYPFWFDYGMRNNIIVYGFTYEDTDWQNNLLNWEDFLGLQWLNSHHNSIDPGKVPHFDSSGSALYGILKPHGGDSLYDLAADFHMTFTNAVQYMARIKQSTDQTKNLHDFKTHVIGRGIARFREFQQKEPRYNSFLSILPEAEKLFNAVSELGKLIEEIDCMDMQGSDCLKNLSRILILIQVQTSFIHSFLFNQEIFLQGGTN
jgi:hypothetical protein